MRLRYHIVDVFTDRPYGGNPLAVIPDAAGLSDRQMQAIACEFNLSETGFVFPPADPAHACRLRIYTPKVELPFAGHPTVGTAFVLAAIGRLARSGPEVQAIFEEQVGDIHVRVRYDGDRVRHAELATAAPPSDSDGPASGPLAHALGLAHEDLVGGAEAPRIVSCGLPWLIVPVATRAAIARLRPDAARLEALLAGTPARGVYLVTRDTGALRSDWHARMCAPAIATHEDPATGSAAAALAGYLALRAPPSDRLCWRVTQGHEMGRPSQIDIAADRADGRAGTVRVGGTCVLLADGLIEPPPP